MNYDSLCYSYLLCSSCGCEVVLTMLKFHIIYLVSCMPRFPLVGKTPSKVSNIYMCTWYSCKFICTYQGGVLSTHRTWWIYSYHILKFSRKMSKFFQRSIPSLLFVLCIKLTWTLFITPKLVLSSIIKKGEIESI